MNIDELINDALKAEKEDYPYFNNEIHDWLVCNGWEFLELDMLVYSYIQTRSGFMIVFDQGTVEVSRWVNRDWEAFATFTNPIEAISIKTMLYIYLGVEL